MMGKTVLNFKFYSSKIFIVFFILSLSFFDTNIVSNDLFSQDRGSTLIQSKKKVIRKTPVNSTKKKSKSNKNKNLLKNKQNLLNYAKRAERRGDNRSAFQYFNRLLKIDDGDFEILEGYIRTSLATQRIKQCQTKLSELLSEYDTNGSKKLRSYFKFLSNIAYFYIASNREQLADKFISQISSSKELDYREKYLLLSSIYEKSGRNEYATKLLLDARSENNTKAKKYLFSYELYKLYLKNLEFYRASIELTNYFIGSEYSNIIAESEELVSSFTSLPIRDQKSILSNNINKINRAYNHNNKNSYRTKSSKFEKKYLEVETGFVKLFDNISDINLKSQIIKNVLNQKDDLENSINNIYSKLIVENKNDSLKVLYDNLNKDFDKLLFSLYYKEKSYRKAFEYIPNEKNLNNQTFNKISIFANQLFNEKEYSLAYSYYSKILDNTDELSNNNMMNRSFIRIFDNYIDVMLRLEKNDEAITFLNKLILGLDSKEQKYLHKDDLYLQLAEIYQYGIFDIEKAEVIYL